MQLAQPMHSSCVPLRMSMPVGQTCTQRMQSTQSPTSWFGVPPTDSERFALAASALPFIHINGRPAVFLDVVNRRFFLFGAAFVLSALILAPKLGAATFVSTTIVGTMAASLVIDHFGVMAYRVQPVTVLRLLGAGLVVSGMLIIQWKR